MARPAKAISTTKTSATTTAVCPACRRCRKLRRYAWFISVLRLADADRLDVEVRDEVGDDRNPRLESVLHLDRNLASLIGLETSPAGAVATPGPAGGRAPPAAGPDT